VGGRGRCTKSLSCQRFFSLIPSCVINEVAELYISYLALLLLTLLQRAVTVLCLLNLVLHGSSSVQHSSLPDPYLILQQPPQVSSFSQVSPSMPFIGL